MTTRLSAVGTLAAKSASAANVGLQSGLTTDEARRRLETFGPNAVPDTAMHPLRTVLSKFWAPVPWMLEAAIVLQVALGDYAQAGPHRRSPGVQLSRCRLNGSDSLSVQGEVGLGSEQLDKERESGRLCARHLWDILSAAHGGETQAASKAC
jgi:hypothetical protein